MSLTTLATSPAVSAAAIAAAFDAVPAQRASLKYTRNPEFRKLATPRASGEEIWQDGLNYTNAIVAYYKKKCPSCDVEEMEAEGLRGLAIALERFDPSRGVKFTTLVGWWVRSTVCGLIKKESHRPRMVSLDQPLTTDGDTGLLQDVLPAEGHGTEETVLRQETNVLSDVRLISAFRCLSARQRRVIELRYFNTMPLAEAAKRLGVSPALVQSEETNALVALNAAMTGRDRAEVEAERVEVSRAKKPSSLTGLLIAPKLVLGA